VDGERKDKVAEIAVSWREEEIKERRTSNILVTSELVVRHILAGRCPVEKESSWRRVELAGDKWSCSPQFSVHFL
jgi:hypothetical protein